jgi:hypothetical protein
MSARAMAANTPPGMVAREGKYDRNYRVNLATGMVLRDEAAELARAFDLAREVAIEQINRRKNREVGAGVTVNGDAFDSDAASLSAVLARRAVIGRFDLVSWRTKDNRFVYMDQWQLQALAQAMADRAQDCMLVAVRKKQEVAAAMTMEALRALDLNEGWPK